MTASSAIPYLKSKLPKYGPLHSGSLDFTIKGSNTKITKRQLFDGIPLSETECEQGWKQLACFESSNPQGCFAPTALMIERAWAAILSAATAQGLDMTAFISSSYVESLLDPAEGMPAEFSKALLESMRAQGADQNFSGDEQGIILDRTRCAETVGGSKLEAMCLDTDKTPTGKLSNSKFTQAWQDAMPENWRDAAQLDALKVWHEITDSGTCADQRQDIYKLEDDGQHVTFIGESSSTAASDAAAPADPKKVLGKRKWHEKFKPSKK